MKIKWFAISFTALHQKSSNAAAFEFEFNSILALWFPEHNQHAYFVGNFCRANLAPFHLQRVSNKQRETVRCMELHTKVNQENSGPQGGFSPYSSSSIPVGFYALQRENVFPERPGQPECQFYMKTGDCKFGAVCRFHHPRERLIPAPDCVLSPMRPSFTTGELLLLLEFGYKLELWFRN